MSNIFNRFDYNSLMELSISTYGNVFLLIMIFSLLVSVLRDRKSRCKKNVSIPCTREILTFFILGFFYNLTYIISILLEGATQKIGFFGFKASVFLYYIVGALLTLLFLQFVKTYIAKKLEKWWMVYIIRSLQICQFICMGLLAITPFTGLLYYYNESNVYVRGRGFWIWQGTSAAIFLFLGIAILFTIKKVDKFVRDLLTIVIIIPLMAFAFEMIFNSSNFNNTFVIIAALLVFLLYEDYRAQYSIENAIAMETVQKKLMMDQIQPHFLHNSLTSIIYYIDKDPEKAKDALVNFSKYLRSNLDSVNTKDMIPFVEELEHTRMYLALEKLRFEDNLDIEYDIREKDFLVPALSLQPMVENAVKHGIRKSETGKGTVKISTKEDDNTYVIVVEDSGSGFDTDMLKTMDDTHIGVKNVMRRLYMECKGTMVFDSVIGKGTVCTIRIPKSIK